MPPILRVVIAFNLFLMAVVCRAQPHSQSYASLEALLASGDDVFTGRIVRITPSELAGPPRTEYSLTIQVYEILKGKPGATLILKRNYDHLARYWSEFRQDGTPILWITRSGLPEMWSMLVIEDALSPKKDPEWLPTLPILSDDLRPLRTRSAVLTRARAFIASAPSRTPLAKIAIPWLFADPGLHASGTSSYMDLIEASSETVQDGAVVCWLTLPVVPDMERLARQMIANPSTLIPPHKIYSPDWERARTMSDDRELKVSGVRMLAHFRSDVNISILKLALADTAYQLYAYPGQLGVTINGTLFPVRRVAYEVLTQWGVKVEKPVIDRLDYGM